MEMGGKKTWQRPKTTNGINNHWNKCQKRELALFPCSLNAVSMEAGGHPGAGSILSSGCCGNKVGTTESAICSLSLQGSRGGVAPHLAPGHPAVPQAHCWPSPKLGSHGHRDAGIQQGSPSTEAQQKQQTIGCTATLHKSQHLLSIFFIQRKSTGVIPAEQRLTATALPQQEKGTALVKEDRQPLVCLLPGKGKLLGFIFFILPFRSRA